MSIGFWMMRKKRALQKAKEAVTNVEQTKVPTETPKKAKKGGVKDGKKTD